MLEQTIAALKAAEAAIQSEYDGVKGWHAQARGALEEAYSFVTGLRTKLEGIEPPAVAEAPAPEPAPDPAADPVLVEEATTSA